MQREESDSVGEMERAFGVRVRRARTDRKLSQRQLAELIAEEGVVLDPSAITRIELGQRAVRLGEAAVLAAVLDLEPRDVVATRETPAASRDRHLNNAFMDVRIGRHSFLSALRKFQDIKREFEADPESTSPEKIKAFYRSLAKTMTFMTKCTNLLDFGAGEIVIHSAAEAAEFNRLLKAMVSNLGQPLVAKTELSDEEQSELSASDLTAVEYVETQTGRLRGGEFHFRA